MIRLENKGLRITCDKKRGWFEVHDRICDIKWRHDPWKNSLGELGLVGKTAEAKDRSGIMDTELIFANQAFPQALAGAKRRIQVNLSDAKNIEVEQGPDSLTLMLSCFLCDQCTIDASTLLHLI